MGNGRVRFLVEGAGGLALHLGRGGLKGIRAILIRSVVRCFIDQLHARPPLQHCVHSAPGFAPAPVKAPRLLPRCSRYCNSVDARSAGSKYTRGIFRTPHGARHVFRGTIEIVIAKYCELEGWKVEASRLEDRGEQHKGQLRAWPFQ